MNSFSGFYLNVKCFLQPIKMREKCIRLGVGWNHYMINKGNYRFTVTLTSISFHEQLGLHFALNKC